MSYAIEAIEIDGDLYTLIPDADVSFEKAKCWYAAYGDHLSTENAGDVCIQAVDWDWLDCSDDEEVAAKVMASDEMLSVDEAESLVAMARHTRNEAEAIEGLLTEVVKAYKVGDVNAVLAALDAARSRENEHGDSPATQQLRSQLVQKWEIA